MQEIKLFKGDITTLPVDAIVNAAKKTLLGGGGVDGAIHRAAGPNLLKECRTLGGCKTGEAKLTNGYNLKAKYVIHTVGPIYGVDSDPAKHLADCYKNSLDLAMEQSVHSVGFPCISTGIYAYPIEEATKIAIKTVKDWMKENSNYDIVITFCCFDEASFDVYAKLI